MTVIAYPDPTIILVQKETADLDRIVTDESVTKAVRGGAGKSWTYQVKPNFM